MQPELVRRLPRPLSERLPQQWRLPLLHLALAWATIFGLFAPVFSDMLHQYWDSSTYNHILFVPPIMGWLVSMRLPELAKLAPRAWWPALVPLSAALILWLLGDMSGIALATHLAMVSALQSSVLLMLGPRVAWALLFPLSFAFFLVPFGDELVPALQMITAKITIALTHWSGIPAEIDGVFIDTPAGLFEVAEACSGVKFLIAMVALGTLAAHICFATWKRRALFMAAAVILPILANGVRAWGTIYIAQSQGVEFAAGFDHIFYGWIFFALVMALLLAASWRFFDRSPDDGFIDGDELAASTLFSAVERFSITPAKALLALMALAIAVSAWSVEAKQVSAPLPNHINLPRVQGWEVADFRFLWWEPRAAGADHRLLGAYRHEGGAQVEVFMAIYSAQEEGREAGAFGEGALMPDSPWSWHSAGPDFGVGKSERMQAGGNTRRLALTLYRHRNYVGGSVARLKLSNLRDRLTLNPQPTAMLIVSAEERQDIPAEQLIREFIASIDPVDQWMDRIVQNP